MFVVIPTQAGIQSTRPFALDSGPPLRSTRNDRREALIVNKATVPVFAVFQKNLTTREGGRTLHLSINGHPREPGPMTASHRSDPRHSRLPEGGGRVPSRTPEPR